ncbi:hypothetical protein M409DRAFT_28646 [Zasmidium cellare ATCC 36951]|uniref:Shikimate dehydrogenase substrate binding N-terminal domain-containing protein n=1 Tax=Zasmidium cellare ATCC 36951 TaxID=1080233 RepID=A0A6A6C4D4_ZASCE|nr:uncharacterized protein M409DRAFT_28646 [Zasmidium cellare ATCC 36951]KAF2161040.1 hypothetical protein M409DRAFT_28646 [Zasmidium cellare ATCC 36951]
MAAEKHLHLAGIGVGHSIAPPMHNSIAKSLDLPWMFYSTECPTLESVISLARDEQTVGLVVTMPYKTSILPHVDAIDEIAKTIGACNLVYRDPGKPQQLHASNTDWLGVKGCLLEKSPKGRPVLSKPALIVGAGGASRAALYALTVFFQSSTIYVLNRDDAEVEALVNDAKRLPREIDIIHVRPGQSQTLPTPYYIVGTVPDLEPRSSEERSLKASLEEFLSRPEKGVLLDMCFKPRRTRTIKLAERLGWSTVEGTHVIGYQIEEQWRHWAGDERSQHLDKQQARQTLLRSAESSPAING